MSDATANADASTSTQDGNSTGDSTSDAGDGFKPITSQDEFDARLKDRLARESAKFADYKDVKAKAAKFDELAAANKSEQEKLNDRLTAAEQAASEARLDALKFKVAAKFKVSDEDASLFLTGSDEETLTRQAERLAGLEAERKKNGAHASREGSNPRAGSPGDERAAVRELFGAG